MINRDIAMVCDALDIPFHVMTGRDRHQDVCDKRTSCVYALYVTGRYKDVDVARAFNKRSHTLVYEVVKRARVWQDYPKAYARQLGYVGKAIAAIETKH